MLTEATGEGGGGGKTNNNKKKCLCHTQICKAVPKHTVAEKQVALNHRITEVGDRITSRAPAKCRGAKIELSKCKH